MPTDLINELQSWLYGAGPWAYLLAPVIMIVVAIIPFPAEVPAMINGMIFGPLVGTAITWFGGLVGAWISFELARRFGRPLAARILPATALASADRFACAAGAPGLLTARLIPIVAFTALNWAAGLTALRRVTFLWTTAIGIAPGAVAFTLSGTGLAAIYRREPGLALVLGVAIVLVLALTLRRYRRSRSTVENQVAVSRREDGRTG